jgi:hypothetical protein
VTSGFALADWAWDAVEITDRLSVAGRPFMARGRGQRVALVVTGGGAGPGGWVGRCRVQACFLAAGVVRVL